MNTYTELKSNYSTSQLLTRIRSVLLILLLSISVLVFTIKMIDLTQFISITTLLSTYFFLNLIFLEKLKYAPSVFTHFITDYLLLFLFLFLTGGYQNPLSIILVFYFLIPPLFLEEKELLFIFFFNLLGLIFLQETKYVLQYNNINFLITFEYILIGTSVIIFATSYWFSKKLNILIEKNKKLTDFSTRVDRYKSLGILTAGVCHELGTPLNTILFNIDELSCKHNISEINIIRRNLLKCMDSLKKLNLQVHDQDNQFYEEIFNPIIAINNLSKEKEQELELEISVHSNIDDIYIKAPKILLLRCVFDLFQNSKQAGASKVDINITSENNSLMIIINDNGPGFQASIIKNFGAPFLTSKENGTGLALYHFKNFIELIGGYISIDNKKGASINIMIPTVKDEV